MKKTLLLIILFGLLVACGSNNHKVVAIKVGDEYYKPANSAAMALDNNTNEKLICEKRVITGSRKKQKACLTEAQKREERRSAEERMERVMNHAIRTNGCC